MHGLFILAHVWFKPCVGLFSLAQIQEEDEMNEFTSSKQELLKELGVELHSGLSDKGIYKKSAGLWLKYADTPKTGMSDQTNMESCHRAYDYYVDYGRSHCTCC